uniref:Uncharacterized protein n=1 Tax=Pyrodinium bahamense TaxID=73915 RepID=A0A7S0AA01_9DINO
MAAAALETPAACGPPPTATAAAMEPAEATDAAVAPGVLLEQRFAHLEEALQRGVWEADGDDMSLYVSDGSAGEGPAGAVFVTHGTCEAEAALVHRLRDVEGARVSRLTAHLVCEELDPDSAGTFTVGLAYDDDFEEAALLALTLRRPRELPFEDELPRLGANRRARPPRPVELHANGQVVLADVGTLPVCLELDAELHWAATPRSVVLRHCLRPVGGGQTGTGVSAGGFDSGQASEVTTGFYTTSTNYDNAKALCLRATGTTRVRLLYLRCSEGEEGA